MKYGLHEHYQKKPNEQEFAIVSVKKQPFENWIDSLHVDLLTRNNLVKATYP
jgi:hypothetical protein